MNYRVKFTDADGVWWTQPFGNWIDACRFVATQGRNGVHGEIFANDRQLAELVNNLWAGSDAEQKRTGVAQIACVVAGCRCGKPDCTDPAITVSAVRVPVSEPVAALAPVYGGFPLLEDADGETERPRDGETSAPSLPHSVPPSPPIPPGTSLLRLTRAWCILARGLAWALCRCAWASFGAWLRGRPRLRVLSPEAASHQQASARRTP